MPSLMIDSDQPQLLLEPRFANVRIATYADLLTPEYVAAAGQRLVVIDRGLGDPLNRATVADIEPGALTVPTGMAKIRQWISEGRKYPTAYHNRADWAEVNQQGGSLPYRHWVATLDGTLVPDGFYMAAVQFAGAQALGFHADLSIVWDDSWNPAGLAIPVTRVKALMDLAATVAKGSAQVLADLAQL